MCAAYLLNLLPSRGGVDGDCPYQLFHGMKPSIDNLKVFGYAAYGLIPSQIRNTKLGDPSVLCVMVGTVMIERLIGCSISTIFR